MKARLTTVSADCSLANAASKPAGAAWTIVGADTAGAFFSAASLARRSWSNRLLFDCVPAPELGIAVI